MLKKIKIAAVAGTLMMVGVAYADLNTRLVAHWNFDDCTATDASGNGYNGTLHSSSQSGIKCVQGIRGKALRFNRVDGDNGSGLPGGDYVIIPTLPAIWSRGFTGCAWASFTDPSRAFERIFDFGNGPERDNLLLTRHGAKNSLGGHFWADGKIHFAQSLPSRAITNGQMQHYCVTAKNTTGLIRLYINGKLAGKKHTGVTRGIVANVVRTSNFLAHSNWPDNEPDFKGILDEVRIWSRPLLASEIHQAYAQDSHLEGIHKGTSGYTVTCTNTITAETVTLPSQTAAKWDCSAAGLRLGPTDSYRIVIDGQVD